MLSQLNYLTKTDLCPTYTYTEPSCTVLVSPSARLLLGDIGFVYQVMSTYDGNRSFASYTKTKTVESDV
jgi:hypothetical protein